MGVAEFYLSNQERLACRKQLTRLVRPQSDRSGYWLRMAFEAIDELGLPMHDFRICLDEFLGLSRLAPLSPWGYQRVSLSI